MMSRQQYIEYLLNTPVNYTCSNLAEHLDGVSHDAVSDFLQRGRVTASRLWELVEPLLNNTEAAYLIIDDSVQNKQYSQHIGLVQRQYSGAEHGLVRGIDSVNLVHYDGQEAYPIDYRIYAKSVNGLTKNNLFAEMLMAAKLKKGIQATTILFDSWYSSVKNLKLVALLDMTFITQIKDHRLVSLSKAQGYIHVQAIEDENARRWPIEQFHRELKQLTGSEKCQCRKARSQRNHVGYCYLAWVSLKVRSRQLGLSVYQVRQRIFDDFLTMALQRPPIPAYLPT